MYKSIYKKISKSCFLLMIVWVLYGYGTVYAQENVAADAPGFSGIIVDSYGRPLQGVEVAVKSNGNKVISDETGTFSIDANEGNTLVFTHPNYLVKEIKISKNAAKDKAFKMGMVEKKLKNPDELDIPYGKTVSKEDYLGAASTVYTDEITPVLSANILGALSGRLPGLYISQKRGFRDTFTGAGIIINDFIGNLADDSKVGYNDNTQYDYLLHGAYSPTVVVDGFQTELFNIDVESIESVSVQKDALSSMLLGGGKSSRGILHITTKKPVGEGFQVSFTGRYGVQEPIKTPKPLPAYQWAYLLNEALVNDGKKGIYSAAEIETFRNGSNPVAYPNINWYDQIMKNSSNIQSYNLNATGGNKTAQYFVSLGYFSEDGLLRESNLNSYSTNLAYERYLVTSKINVNVLDNLKVSATIIGRIEEGNQPGGYVDDNGNPQGASSIMNNMYTTSGGVYPIHNPDGSYAGNNSYQQNLMASAISSGYIKDLMRDGYGNIVIDHDMSWLTAGLSARAVGSISSQSRSALVRNKQEPVFLFTPYSDGSGNGDYERFGSTVTQKNGFAGVSNYQSMFGQVSIDYKKTIGVSHNIEGTVSADIRQVLDNYQLPEVPANFNAAFKYNYQNKYFAQAAISQSYLNRFAPGKRWGTFYAFGLGWDISKEAFMQPVDWVNTLKLRGVFGQTGNGIGISNYYSWRQQYDTDIFSVEQYSYSQGSAYTGWYNTPALGLIETGNSLANPNLTWERAYKLNLGLDANLFDNKLLFAADFYSDKYFDLLMTRGKSIELIGLYYPDENIGKVRYNGLDLSLTYQNNVGSFNYYVTGNWSITQSKTLFMDEQNVPEEYMRRTGNPYGARYGLIAEGFFQTQEEITNSPVISGYRIIPGDLKYKDMNGDNVINEYDQTIIGGTKPLSFFGLNLGFEYKGLEVSALFQGTYNRDIYFPDAGREYAVGFIAGYGTYSQGYEHTLNRWTPETAETALFPRLSTNPEYNVSPNNMRNSFWVESGNYIRLKNLNVAYTLPDSFSRNYLGGMKVKVFVGGQNLWTQAAFNLVDPEVIDYRNYPVLRGFNTGVNIKF